MELTDKDLEKVYQLGIDYLKSSSCCAQCTVAALLEALGLENNNVFRAACGLAGGIGATSNGSCGVLTGGTMVIGLLFGRDMDNFSNPTGVLTSYDLTKKLHDFFYEEYNSIQCGDIQNKIIGRSFNLHNPQDVMAALDLGMLDCCSIVVGKGAKKALEIIMNHNGKENFNSID